MRIFTLLVSVLFITSGLRAQAPQKINYQGLARDAAGAPLSSITASVQFELLQGTITGSVVYTEQVPVVTSALGLFNTQIGGGTGFSTINWKNGPYFLRVSIDLQNSAGYVALGTQQLLSVPYAIYAENTKDPALTYSNNVLGVNGSTVQVTQNQPTVAINGSGLATVTNTNNSTFDVSVPVPSLSATGTTLTLTQGTVTSSANISLPPNSITVTASGSLATITTPTTGTAFNVNVATPTLALSPNNASITIGPDGNTVALPVYSLSQNSNSISLTQNGLPVATTTLAPTNLTLSGAANNVLTAGGNNVTMNTYTSGTGISMTGGPNYTISSAAQTTSVTAGANNNISVTGSAPNYTVSAPSYSVSFPNSQQLQLTNGINTSNVALPSPTLAYAAGNPNTLTVGSNSISIPGLFSNNAGNLYPTTLTNSLGIGTAGPLADKMEINYLSSPSTSHLRITQATGGDLFNRIRFSNAANPSKYWMNSVTNNASDPLSGYNVFYFNGTSGFTYFTVGGDGKVSVNPFALSYAALFEVNGRTNLKGNAYLDSSSIYKGIVTPILSLAGQGRIFYNSGTNKLMVSENGGAYTNLLSAGWGLTGNLGSNPATDFIGTTDNVPLNFRVNNQKAGTIDPLLQNVFLGSLAGNANTSGNSNVAIGHIALQANTSGFYNVAIGSSGALSNNVTGSFNTAINNDALLVNTIGNGNTALGKAAMHDNISGSFNTASGYAALFSNTTGSLNTAHGQSSLFSNTTGSLNAGLGYLADVITGTLTNASALGANAKVGSSNSMVLGDTSNIKVGIGTGYPTQRLHVKGVVRIVDGTQGANKVLTSDASGNASWQAASSGWGLTGNASTTASVNYIGTSDNVPLSFRVNGQTAGRIDHLLQNVFFGHMSGQSITTGQNNAAVGTYALWLTTSGGGNSAFGQSALYMNTTGLNNTATGYGALYGNTTGSLNTASGESSLYQNAGGVENSAYGRASMYSNNGGSRNAAFGSAALYSNVGGTNNTALGYLAGFSSANGSGNVFVGSNAGYNETGSNKLYIANNNTVAPLIYGDFTLRRVGFNTNTPAAGFEVNGNTLLDSSLVARGITAPVVSTAGQGKIYFDQSGSKFMVSENNGAYKPLVASSPWVQAVGAVTLTNSTDKVGIGTNAPVENVQVETAANSAVSIISGNSSSSSLAFGSTGNHFMGTIRYSNLSNTMSFWTNNTADRLFIDNAGNIGIKNNSPGAYDLSIYNPGSSTSIQLKNSFSGGLGFVLGSNTAASNILSYENTPMYFGNNGTNMMNLSANGILSVGNTAGAFANTGLIVARSQASDNRLVIAGGDNTNTYGGILTLCENLNQSQGMSLRLDAGGNRMWITTDPTGNSPIVTIGGYSGSSPGVGIGAGYLFSNAPTNGLIVQGNMGIGTAAPASKFHTEVSNGRFMLYDFPPSGSTVLLGELEGGTGLAPQQRWRVGGSGNWIDIGQDGSGSFVVEGNDNPRLVVQNGGNVGINNSSPTAKLDVAGTFKLADGTQGANKVLTSDASGNASWQAASGSSVCYIKDVKSSGTVGGTFSSGSWISRTLNTVEGDASIVNLSANQFTLQAGVYDIYAEAPAHNVNNHKIKLYNVSDNSDDIVGGYSQCNGVGDPQNATLMGRITIGSAKVFALQHRCNSTQASDGFGSANAFGVVEVFTQIKISKVQ